jgi:hypothetical protein
MSLWNMALALVFILATFAGRPAAAASCESLISLKLPETTITAAQPIAAGTYTAPDGEVFTNMPAFCRLAATLTPTSDSDIGIEVWMPASIWNGKFEGVGNGGFAGSIEYSALASGVRLGYATVSTDTGHVGSTYDGSFALGHPQKIIDFGYRSIHLMTIRGKQIANAFYGESPQHSYFDGCSTGGRQALMEAQRFANDYDGIVAGDPVAYYTTITLVAICGWCGRCSTSLPAPFLLLKTLCSAMPSMPRATLLMA